MRNGSGCRRRTTLGARRPGTSCSKKRCGRWPEHRWLGPAFRPKRSAPRAPQGSAPVQANGSKKNRMSQVEPNANRRSYGPLDAKFLKKIRGSRKREQGETKRKTQKGDILNEVRKGTFLNGFDRRF